MLSNKGAVSPIIATVLLVAIIVAAFVVLFTFTIIQVHRVAPKVTPRINIKIEQITPSFRNITFYVRNVGSHDVTVDAIYFLNITTNTVEYAYILPKAVQISPGKLSSISVKLPTGFKPGVYRIMMSTKEAGKVSVPERVLSYIPSEAVCPVVLNIEKCFVNRGYQSNCTTVVLKVINEAENPAYLKRLILWSWSTQDTFTSFWGRSANGDFDFLAGAPGNAWWIYNDTNWINETQMEISPVQLPSTSFYNFTSGRVGYRAYNTSYGDYSFLDPHAPVNIIRARALIIYEGEPIETPIASQPVVVANEWFEPNPLLANPYEAYNNGTVVLHFRSHFASAIEHLYVLLWNYNQSNLYTSNNISSITVSPGISLKPTPNDEYDVTWSLQRENGKIYVKPIGGKWLCLDRWLPANGITTDFNVTFTLNPPPTQGEYIYIFLVTKFQSEVEYWFWCFIQVKSP